MTRLNATLVGAVAFAVAMSTQVVNVRSALSQQQAERDATSLDDLILFDSRTPGGTENIFVIRPDGSRLRQLTAAVRGSALSHARMASWSSDRSRIVFEGYDEKGYQEIRGDIYVIDVDGSNLRRLSCPDRPCHQPRWSPDDEEVVFVAGDVREAESAIFVMNADGSDPRQLSPWGLWGTWSPSGRHIAFISASDPLGKPKRWREGDVLDLFVMNADGSNVRRLTEQHGANQDPDWSPDGRTLVFDSYRDGSFDIYSIELDTGRVRRLTDHPAADARPAFSPDGQHIVFHSTRDDSGPSDLYVMDRDGSNLRRLTKLGAEGGSNASHPDW